MGKMHELLAVENDIVGLSNKTLEESHATFKNKSAEFYTGGTKTYKPFDDADRDLVPPIVKEIVDTVISKLKFTFSKLIAEYDLLLQKEATNQQAVADIIVDGTVLFSNAPVNFLLTLERRWEKVRNLIAEAPTLPNGPKWECDTQRGEGYYKLAAPQVSYRTKKEKTYNVVVPPTKEHPAQVKEGETTTTIGQYEEMLFDSRMTSHDKSVLLERVDTLLKEIRKAIRRANQIDVVERNIGKKLFDYVLTGVVS